MCFGKMIFQLYLLWFQIFSSRIHSQGLSRSKDHPDTRAVFYEADIYNKRKLLDFLSTLEGFKEGIAIIEEFKSCVEDLK